MRGAIVFIGGIVLAVFGALLFCTAVGSALGYMFAQVIKIAFNPGS